MSDALTDKSISSSLLLGEITMGNRRGQTKTLKLVEVLRHLAFFGGSGSGKTWGMKVCAEGLVARDVPILAIDQMGDLMGLGIPVGSPEDYARVHLKPPYTSSADEWKIGGQCAALLRKKMHVRVLTPCSNAGEQVSILPLTSRPKNYDYLKAKYPEDITHQADAQAGNFLTRIGFKVSRTAAASPSYELGVATEVLKRCWEENLRLDTPEGMQLFGRELVSSTSPELDDEAKKKIAKGLQSISLGTQAQWFEGIPFDLDRLLRAPEGKVPVIIVHIQHINPADRPWVIGQIVQNVANWCTSKGPSPERPRLALMVDELAGDGGANPIMPPGNIRSHPSGEALRRVLRQGRHYGLCLLGGTQSPGDVDYKSFGNFGTRIIGRLQTPGDVEKVIYGLEGNNETLTKFIVSSQPGNLFVVPPSGEWDKVKMRMLGTAHTTILKFDFDRFYEAGIWRRPSVNEVVEDRVILIAELEGMIDRYRGKVSHQVIEQLELAKARAAPAVPAAKLAG